MLDFLKKILGDPNQRKIQKLMPTVDLINDFEAEISKLTDEELQAKTDFFRNELANRERSDNPKQDRALEKEVLHMILPEAFAVVREAAKRVLNMRHYDMQLVGGMVLHEGGIAEMRTGEGKTLVATLPAYLNALSGKGVHVVTVNDYLAKRDAEWMGKLYNFLGLSVGTVLSEQRGFDSFMEKKKAYGADITYGTNNEFGFDYLRDNMAGSRAQLTQREFNFAIIDEVDSILIDEARTPLIISGRLEQSAELYQTMARIAPLLELDKDYSVEEKARNVILLEDGIDKAQELLNVEDLYDPKTNLAHYIVQALRAKELFKADIDYVVNNNEVVIVDEFTGRLMEGRRWSDGLHQSIEAKEGVKIQDETQTLASITFQNLFRLYPKLSGMTGTAMTEEAEFGKIYSLEVTAIPTNKPDIRKDNGDIIYKNEKVKFFKAVEEIVECHQEGRPVLVGTTSIEKSEWISQTLTYPKELSAHLHDKSSRLLKRLENDKEEGLLRALKAYLKTPEAHAPKDFVELAQDNDKPGGELYELLMGISRTLNAIQAIRNKIPHTVLNAKHHESEAKIVAQAGRKGAVMIATNMAGRGTDILLGGNPDFLAREHFEDVGRPWRDVPEEEFQKVLADKKAQCEKEKAEVLDLGGLHIIGTERHESRRIDNQLRGRAARQGDPGSTRFYLSLEDTLMRLFGGQKISGLMDMLHVDETMPITAGMVTKAIEGAQRKVEAYHFDIRKNILKYDDVLTEQRSLIYSQRLQVLNGDNLRDSVLHMIRLEMERLVTSHLTPEANPEDLDPEGKAEMLTHLHATVPQLAFLDDEAISGLSYHDLITRFQTEAEQAYQRIEEELTQMSGELEEQHGIMLSGLDPDEVAELKAKGRSEEEIAERTHPMRRIERDILLSIIDAKWIDYLHNLDNLRESIGLRAYGQKDPLIEYKREAFDMFQSLSYDIQRETVALLYRARIQIQLERQMDHPDEMSEFIDTPLTDAQNVEQIHPQLSNEE